MGWPSRMTGSNCGVTTGFADGVAELFATGVAVGELAFGVGFALTFGFALGVGFLVAANASSGSWAIKPVTTSKKFLRFMTLLCNKNGGGVNSPRHPYFSYLGEDFSPVSNLEKVELTTFNCCLIYCINWRRLETRL